MASSIPVSIPGSTDQGLDPRQALGDYFETYIERDVSPAGRDSQPGEFPTFCPPVCWPSPGQLVNLSSLRPDAGVSHTTARQWLTVLETSHIIFQLATVSRQHSQAAGQVTKTLLLRRWAPAISTASSMPRRLPPIPSAAPSSRTMVVAQTPQASFQSEPPVQRCPFSAMRGAWNAISSMRPATAWRSRDQGRCYDHLQLFPSAQSYFSIDTGNLRQSRCVWWHHSSTPQRSERGGAVG